MVNKAGGRDLSCRRRQFIGANFQKNIQANTMLMLIDGRFHKLRVFVNWFLLRIFGHIHEEVEGYGRKLRNYELGNLNYLPDDILITKSKRM
jgi:hypothetical protein